LVTGQLVIFRVAIESLTTVDQGFFPTKGVEPPASGSTGNRKTPVEFKIQTKTRSSNGVHRYTDWFDRETIVEPKKLN
jgi:hypothetical protein